MFSSQVHITGQPDPAKVMEFMEKMEPEEMRKVLDEALDLQQRNQGATREERIARFRRHRSDLYQMMNTGKLGVMFTFTSSWDVKPQRSSPSAGTLTDMLSRELQVGTTHRGRRLSGRIIESPLFTGSSCAFLMDDLSGELVHVSVYNVPGMNWQVGERMFYKGREITIAEPFFKVHTDFSRGVRVDNPDDISSCDIPKAPAEWREKGNECYKARRFQEARDFYTKGWEALSEARQDLAVLLTNRALCCFNAGDPKACARLAGCAWHLSPAYKKAQHWLREGVQALLQSSKSSPLDPSSWPVIPGLVTWERPVFGEGSMPASRCQRGKKKAKTWREVKDEGKALFLDSKWEQAGARYHEAAAKHKGRGEVAHMLGNLAAVGVETKDWKLALQCSTVAALLPPATQALAGRVWVRRARALEGLGNAGAPQCLAGVDLPGVKEEEEALRKRWSARERVTPISGRSTEEQYDELQGLVKDLEGDKSGPEMMAMIPQMYAMAPSSVKRRMEQEYGPLVKRQLAPFHTQFPREHGWPVSDPQDVALCQEILFSAHAHAAVHPWMSEHCLRTGTYTFGPAEWLRRWRSSEAVRRVSQAKGLTAGTIISVKESLGESLKYTELVRHSFANNLPRKQILNRGTVHVAVGFNDLNLLLHCQLAGAPPSRRQGPLRFVGFDASPFSVAKSMVIAEMLRRGPGGPKGVPIQHCLQAWYSSGWSAKASANFRACAAALATGPGSKATNKAVQSYLLHWASATDVPLPEARHRWLKSRDTTGSTEMAQFKRHKDRMAVCSYTLTGDVLGEGERAEVGSLAMWSVPQGSPPLEDGENILQALDFEDLARRGNPTGGQGEPKGDVMEDACGMTCEQLQQVRGWLTEGSLEVDLRCSFVAPGTPAAKEIQDLRPWTVSWSNVLDFMAPKRFHQLARECSKHGDTIHFGCSMNWTSEVLGACLMDTEDLGFRAFVLEETHTALNESFAILPSLRLLENPPFDTALNTTEYLLGATYAKNWRNHFFNREHTGGEVQVGECSVHPYNPLARSNSMLDMTWTYDNSVRMVPHREEKGNVTATVGS